MQILPLGDELFHAEGRTDMTKLKSLFGILLTHLKTRINYELMFVARGCDIQQGIYFSMVVSGCRRQRTGKEVK
jgi:hypothetical protein